MNILNYTIRIEEELMERLRIMAKEHKRSVNSEVLEVIEKAIKEFEKENEKEA